MGVINLSPESFSGDGLTDKDEAIEQARLFAAQGADILDIGGQSTRPGFAEISVRAEVERLIPVIEGIRSAVELPISVDTYRAVVAAAALDAGAHLINDIHGFRADEAMAPLLAGRAVPAVVMHNQRGREFHDVISDVENGLGVSLEIAAQSGLPRGSLIVDPGFGFGWTVEQNLELLRRLAELRRLGLPILVGTSRKSTLGAILDLPPGQRLWGTAATVAIAIANGADIVRVHDVMEMVQVCRITDAIVRSGS